MREEVKRRKKIQEINWEREKERVMWSDERKNRKKKRERERKRERVRERETHTHTYREEEGEETKKTQEIDRERLWGER